MPGAHKLPREAGLVRLACSRYPRAVFGACLRLPEETPASPSVEKTPDTSLPLSQGRARFAVLSAGQRGEVNPLHRSRPRASFPPAKRPEMKGRLRLGRNPTP